jgi:hypothetical protein
LHPAVRRPGTVYTLSAATAAELTEWVLHIEAAAAGKAPPGGAGPASAPSLERHGSAPASHAAPMPPPQATLVSGKSLRSDSAAVAPAQISLAERLGSGRLFSTRSAASSSALLGAVIPDVAMRVHDGWMTKKGEGLMAKSQQRWFVLFRSGECHYFDSEWHTEDERDRVVAAKGHKGVISMAGVRAADIARAKPSSASDFTFTIATPKRKWILVAPSADSYQDWRDAFVAILVPDSSSTRGMSRSGQDYSSGI